MKTAKDILEGKGAAVWSISPKAKVYDALKLMSEKSIGALMVMDEKGAVHGILSERDYARKVILLGKSSKETLVEEIMTPEEKMVFIKPEGTVEDCMVLMTGKHIRHLPVCDGTRMTGMISIGDVLKAVIAKQQILIKDLENYIVGGRS